MSARLPHPEEAKTPKEKNPAAVALGLLGGHKGGTTTAKNRTPAERSAAARHAARARWAKVAIDNAHSPTHNGA